MSCDTCFLLACVLCLELAPLLSQWVIGSDLDGCMKAKGAVC